MSDAVLLKTIEEGSGCVLHLRLLHNNYALEVGMHAGGLEVSPNRNVGVVTGSLLGVIDPAETLVEEVIEALMNVIRLAHHDSVTLDCRVTDCSNRVDLREVMNITHIQSNSPQNCRDITLFELHQLYAWFLKGLGLHLNGNY